MRKTRYPQLSILPLWLLAINLVFPALAFAVEEDVSREDPARWYQSADTAKLHYKNLVKEAHAAGAQALLECKPLKGAEARNCRKEARDHVRNDLARARRIFKARSDAAK